MTNEFGHDETRVIHGDSGLEQTRDVAPPLHLTSTFAAGSAADFAEMATQPRHAGYYTRYGNPTVARAEQMIAGLEGAESALLAATGMGAIATTILTLVKSGDHIVAQKNHYMGTSKLLSDLLPGLGVSATFVDQTENSAFEDAIRDTTVLILVETPSNPTMQLTDLPAIAQMARERSIVTLADNTFASPLNQQPLSLGIDLSVHAGTKYLGGHHDLLAGVVCGSTERVERIWNTSIMLGATASPFDAWLLLRGLRTLPLRVRQHNASAEAVAGFLDRHPEVEAVYYPGLETHPQHALARRQMRGFGGVLSFSVRGGYAAAQRVMANLQLITQAVSLGGFESLAVHAAAMWEGTLGEAGAIEAGVQPSLIRLSIGLEHPDDIIADLDQALSGAG
ncbi:MAG: PLP-dependent aspartate aminotransferase family protein [Thermomicrobiales bacterium]